MFPASLRIYLTANGLVGFVFAFAFFPEGVVLGFIALCYSLLFSLPALGVLCLCFFLLEKCRPGFVASWLLLLVVTGGCAFLPAAIFSGELSGDRFFLLISLASAYGGLLLQSLFIHHYFQSIHYATEEITESY